MYFLQLPTHCTMVFNATQMPEIYDPTSLHEDRETLIKVFHGGNKYEEKWNVTWRILPSMASLLCIASPNIVS